MITARELVLVRWHDAWFNFDVGTDLEDVYEDYVVQTVGFVVKDGQRFLSVAQEVLPNGDGFRAVTHIPKNNIDLITPLEQMGERVVGL
jgi:hypothetical protein